MAELLRKFEVILRMICRVPIAALFAFVFSPIEWVFTDKRFFYIFMENMRSVFK